MKVDEIRERFLKFFEERGHMIYPSDSLVPRNDPSLLFSGAGMNQFKDEFLGKIKGPRRAATCQKCLRTGDLENVGKTPGHHSFFEMLGNFSFGDYFKKEAILWAWEFLTKELTLKERDLWVSVYKDDKEAYDVWKDIVKIPSEKILKFGEKENFWPSNAPSEGPNGPCGPCSEIFFAGADGVEIWNLVFTQFDRREGGILDPLPNKNIDTGMGLERIARVLQGKKTNFEIDSFQPIVTTIHNLSRLSCTGAEQLVQGCVGGGGSMSYENAISDHIRAVTFAISDGVMPSNEERGYVIRKLIRRAFWYGRNLGLTEPFLYRIVPVVVKVMGKPYPELMLQRENIASIVLEEEKRFQNTLQEGLDRLKEMLDGARPRGVLPGEDAFKLYDTYGFPLELTKEISEAENIKIDVVGFEVCMEHQRAQSKKGSTIEISVFDQVSITDSLILEKIKKRTEFIEDTQEIQSEILEIIVNKQAQDEIREGERGIVILKETNFYGEKGGQVGDTGELIIDNKVIAQVMNAIDLAGIVQHEVEIKRGILRKGDIVIAKIDAGRREDIMKNHTATHILHHALRKVLGPHVKQAGSLVAPDRLRFDFTHFKALTGEELVKIEDVVNADIRKGSEVTTGMLPLKEARAKGAIALFGEKYGEEVRMVSVGDYSRELCGGTHVKNTAQVRFFKIISESSIASGVRRIEAITGEPAYQKLKEEHELLSNIAEELRVKPEHIPEAIETLMDKLKKMEKALDKFSSQRAHMSAEGLLNGMEKIHDKNVIIGTVQDADIGLLRKVSDILKNRLKQEKAVFALVSARDDMTYMVTGTYNLSKEEQVTLDAVKILNKGGSLFGLKGGGRPDFAQAGGKIDKNTSQVLIKIEEIIKGAI